MIGSIEHRLTKDQWIVRLSEPRDQWAHITDGQVWLQRLLQYYCDLPGDYTFSRIDDFMDMLQESTRKYVAARGFDDYNWRPTYADWLSGYPEAIAQAMQVAEVCRHIGGAELGRHVYAYVMAEHSALTRRMSDFMREVYLPFYPLIARSSHNTVEIELGGTRVLVNLLMIGRSHVLLVGGDSAVNLTGSSHDESGRSFGVSLARATTLAAALQLFDEAIAAAPKTEAARKQAMTAGRLWAGGGYTHV